MAEWGSGYQTPPNGGIGYRVLLQVTETGTNAAANTSTLSWALYLQQASSSWGPGFSGYSGSWSVVINGATVGGSSGAIPSGSWQGSYLLGSGTTTVGHNPDGSKTVAVSGAYDGANSGWAIDYVGTSGNLALTTLKVAPATPTGVTATRVSDTQINLSWSHSSASNGQPQSNQVYRSVNGGAYEKILDIAATNNITVAASPNQKIRYKVQAWNGAGFSGMSAESAPVYTTPGAPTAAVAAKNASQDIVVSFTENVDYAEHEHEVWHGTVVGGVTTWDGSPAVTLASGVVSWTHTAPNPAQVHVYRVRAKAGSLFSAYATTDAVQLLAPPNAPTLPALPSYSDRAAAFVLTWTHNPVDSTPQAYYEVEWWIEPGVGYSSTGKVASTTMARTFAAAMWTANQTVTFRVRTWGQATTGGADGTGASPWSAVRSTTFKTRPVASIVAPANGAVLGESALTVTLGFSQAEGASFVDATLTLKQGATVVETKQTATLAGTAMDTRVANGGAYTLEATVRDSNGLVSTVATAAFTVDYLDPVPAGVTVTYLPETGFAQLDLIIPEPGVGEAEAVQVRITRTINGATETVLAPFPTEGAMTILDTTPTIKGTNEYRVVTISADGSELATPVDLVTTEGARAFLAKGQGYSTVVSFGYRLRLQAAPFVDQSLVKAAGRSRPIGLYGRSGGLMVSGSASLYAASEIGSTPEQIETLLLMPGRACYRDPSGRRVFGQVEGVVSREHGAHAELQFTVTETSS